MNFFEVGVNLIQSWKFHETSIDQANSLHLEQVEQAEDHHKISVALDRDLARREKRRDIWGQRVDENNTLLIIETVMFSCGFAILIEGQPPPATSPFIIFLFSLTIGLSISLLFLGINLSMVVHNRMAKYNIGDSSQYYKKERSIRQHGDVETFFQSHCAHASLWAKRFFNLGTIFLLICSMTLFGSKLYIGYESPLSAMTFTSFVFITLICWILIMFKYSDDILASDEEVEALYSNFLEDQSSDSETKTQFAENQGHETHYAPLKADSPFYDEDYDENQKDDEIQRDDEREPIIPELHLQEA